jgi:Uma2 family endonuclease
MASEPKPRLTIPEYLALERQSDIRSEYLDGEMIAMTGASRSHSRIALNIAASLDRQVKPSGCEVFISDMRVQTADGLLTYPDVIVVCGNPEFTDSELDTLLNPTLIAEVLSPSTENYDRGVKFARYRTTPSLREYLLIEQKRVHLEHFLRRDGDWLLHETDDPGDVLELRSIDCRLALTDVYDRVLFHP